MKRVMIIFGVVCTLGISISVYAKDNTDGMESMMEKHHMSQHHQMMHMMNTDSDKRTSLCRKQ